MSTSVVKLMNLLQSVAAMNSELKIWLDEKVDVLGTAGDSALLEGKSFEEIRGIIGDDLAAALALLQQEIDAHIARRDNPNEVTKVQVGLGDVQDLGVATLEEAEAAQIADKLVTAQGLGAFWAKLVEGVPESLDTIHEISAAFQNNPEVINLIQGTVTGHQVIIGTLQQSRVDQLGHVDENYGSMNGMVSEMKEALRNVRGAR